MQVVTGTLKEKYRALKERNLESLVETGQVSEEIEENLGSR